MDFLLQISKTEYALWRNFMDWKYAEHDMPKNISEKEIPDSQLKVDWCICFTILFFTYSQFDMYIKTFLF